MKIEEVVEPYRSSQTLPRKCHLNWLKENFNPILYDIDKSLNINWGCQTCSRNYMSMITRYLDELNIILAEANSEAERIAMEDIKDDIKYMEVKEVKEVKEKRSGKRKRIKDKKRVKNR